MEPPNSLFQKLMSALLLFGVQRSASAAARQDQSHRRLHAVLGDFGQRGLDVIGGGKLGAGERRREQRVVGEEIDLAREPPGSVIHAGGVPRVPSGSSQNSNSPLSRGTTRLTRTILP